MRRKCLFIAAILSISLITSCSNRPTNEELWRTAMEDAVYAYDDEIMDLVSLTPEDKNVIWDDAGEKVLLATWHGYGSAGYPMDERNEIWATSFGEVLSWYTDNGKNVTDWDLRFAQLLGMPEESRCTHFSLFWASPDDVIRPAYETDATKPMNNDYSLVSGEWKTWFDGNILYSYFYREYPWTRLGYTYDWGNSGNEYGLSEFLVQDATKTTIEATYTTEEFAEFIKSRAE